MTAAQHTVDAHGKVESLAAELAHISPADAGTKLASFDAGTAVKALEHLGPVTRYSILSHLKKDQLGELMSAADKRTREHWKISLSYEPNSIGSLMTAPTGVFSPETTISEAVEKLREVVKTEFVTYVFVVDPQSRLVGVVVMREMLLGNRDQRLADIMLKNPFSLRPEMPLTDAMKAVLNRHYPVYPVCDSDGVLVGLVRGQTLFEAQAIEISAQAGSMVGVEKEERVSTPWPRCLKSRHPWLQLNLLTAFVAAAVVGIFQNTIDQIVVLAVFLPVLAGQSGNTGCQALAVALRGMTLGEFMSNSTGKVLIKEALLGLLNGALVGVTAGIGMAIYASMQQNANAIMLGAIVFFAMIISCVISGLSGVLVPLTLKKLGADPATASSIFLTTATDVISMGSFLGLATWLIL